MNVKQPDPHVDLRAWLREHPALWAGWPTRVILTDEEQRACQARLMEKYSFVTSNGSRPTIGEMLV